MKYTKEYWISKLSGIEFEFITIISIDDHNTANCLCQCGKTFTKKASKLTPTSNCGCMKNFVNSRAQKKYFSIKENRDKTSRAIKKYMESHPETKIQISNSVKQWCKDNSDLRKKIGEKYSTWCKNNPDRVTEKNKNISDWQSQHRDIIDLHNKQNAIRIKKFRLDSITDELSNKLKLIIDNSSFNKFINGDLKTSDFVMSVCPICDNYCKHRFRDILTYKTSTVLQPLCRDCYSSFTSSTVEQEIADFISTFYNESPIRNSREIIPPLELDLYYHEKQIAIEFNGDYWHSNLFKGKDYHYNKFLQCHNNGITLVSIFENHWNLNNEAIHNYLKDLFDGKDNELSLTGNSTHNNNYPLISREAISLSDHIEDSYMLPSGNTVVTCGFSRIKRNHKIS